MRFYITSRTPRIEWVMETLKLIWMILHRPTGLQFRITYFAIFLSINFATLFSETYPHGFIGRRNLNHRISSISHVSDSSVDSDEGILRHKLNSSIIDIERTDSGVGSETSKSSKASVEIRRAPSLSKSSDSGSGSGHEIPDVCPDCEQELGNH